MNSEVVVVEQVLNGQMKSNSNTPTSRVKYKFIIIHATSPAECYVRPSAAIAKIKCKNYAILMRAFYSPPGERNRNRKWFACLSVLHFNGQTMRIPVNWIKLLVLIITALNESEISTLTLQPMTTHLATLHCPPCPEDRSVSYTYRSHIHQTEL